MTQKDIEKIYKQYPPHPCCIGKIGMNIRFLDIIVEAHQKDIKKVINQYVNELEKLKVNYTCDKCGCPQGINADIDNLIKKWKS